MDAVSFLLFLLGPDVVEQLGRRGVSAVMHQLREHELSDEAVSARVKLIATSVLETLNQKSEYVPVISEEPERF